MKGWGRKVGNVKSLLTKQRRTNRILFLHGIEELLNPEMKLLISASENKSWELAIRAATGVAQATDKATPHVS